MGLLIVMVPATVQVLVTASKEELNFILLNVNCAALAEVVSRVTMDMLTGSAPGQRLPELQALTRSAPPCCHLDCCNESRMVRGGGGRRGGGESTGREWGRAQAVGG